MILKNLPASSAWKFWILLSLAVKGLIFSWRLLFDHAGDFVYHGESFALSGGDSLGYFEPMENLLQYGRYEDDFRMPGYGWLYFLLRLFLSIPDTLNIIIVLQLLFSALSVYLLAHCALFLFKREIYFYLTFVIYLISTFVSLWDPYLLTESFTTSALITSTYFILKPGKDKIKCFIGGVFLTWAIFMKPVLVPLLIFFIPLIIARNRSFLVNTIFFLLPFLCLDGIWVIRNYETHGRFIPLQKHTFWAPTQSNYIPDLYEFMHSFGGSIAHWEPGGEVGFFYPGRVPGSKKEISLPTWIYTSRFNYDSMVSLRNEINFYHSIAEGKLKDSLNQQLKSKIGSYTISVREEKPFVYHIRSRLHSSWRYLLNSPTYYLFHQDFDILPLHKKLIVCFYWILYFIVLIGGAVGIILMIVQGIREKKFDLLGIALSGGYLATVFPFVFKMDEPRYFVNGYPFFVLSLIFLYKFVGRPVKTN